MWYEGCMDGYHYQAKVYDEGSIYGINEGRISKLWISRDGAEAQAAFEKIIARFA